MAAGNIVRGRMHATPDPQQAALVRRIAVGRSLQRLVDAQPVLEYEEFVSPDLELAHATGKKLASGQCRQHLGTRSRIRRMPGNVTRKWRYDKRRSLIGPPGFGQNPPHSRGVNERIIHVVLCAPRVQLDFADVLVGIACERIAGFDQFNVTGL